jgi:hypothetical protein
MAPRGNKNAQGNRGGGRPPKFKPEYCRIAKCIFEIGGTDADLAIVFDVSQSSIRRLKTAHPEFLESCKLGAEHADARVVASFYQRAVGYERKAVKILSYKGHSWAPEYVEEVPADMNAARFWLSNRRPDRWKDLKQIETRSGDDDPFTAYLRSINGCILRPVEPSNAVNEAEKPENEPQLLPTREGVEE